MGFQVGDVVRLVKVPSGWDNAWGVVGATATVLALSGEDVRVDYGGDTLWWYWGQSDIEQVEPEHTPDDLAMALELADIIHRGGSWQSVLNDHVAEWLHAEVIAALRGAR